jgi:hypothetical protein
VIEIEYVARCPTTRSAPRRVFVTERTATAATGSAVEPEAEAGLPLLSSVGVVAVAVFVTDPVTFGTTCTVISTEIVSPFGRPTSAGVAHVTSCPVAEQVKPSEELDET